MDRSLSAYLIGHSYQLTRQISSENSMAVYHRLEQHRPITLSGSSLTPPAKGCAERAQAGASARLTFAYPRQAQFRDRQSDRVSRGKKTAQFNEAHVSSGYDGLSAGKRTRSSLHERGDGLGRYA
jgi:hypothetical protein